MPQVLNDFRKVLKEMMPDKHVAARTEFSAYLNSEGLFGDPDVMAMTEDGHAHQIPTYQFWYQEGEIVR